MNDLVEYGIEWAIARYGIDPLASRSESRIRRVLTKALAKAGNRTPGWDERTVIKALSEVATTDDVVVCDYLAGVIASSDGTDSGVSAVAQIGRLTSLQLRLHYVIYRQVWRSESESASLSDLRSHQAVAADLDLFLALDPLLAALDIGGGDAGVRHVLSALHVLAREDLIRGHSDAGPSDLRKFAVAYEIGEPGRLSELRSREFPCRGLICRPTPVGIELFLRGCGSEHYDPTYIRELPNALVQLDVADVDGELIRSLPMPR
jgi:hypothetical protein